MAEHSLLVERGQYRQGVQIVAVHTLKGDVNSSAENARSNDLILGRRRPQVIAQIPLATAPVEYRYF